MRYGIIARVARGRALPRLIAALRPERQLGWKYAADALVGDWGLDRLCILAVAVAAVARVLVRLRKRRVSCAAGIKRPIRLRPALRIAGYILAVLSILALAGIAHAAVAAVHACAQAALEHWPAVWLVLAIALVAGVATSLPRLCRKAMWRIVGEVRAGTVRADSHGASAPGDATVPRPRHGPRPPRARRARRDCSASRTRWLR